MYSDTLYVQCTIKYTHITKIFFNKPPGRGGHCTPTGYVSATMDSNFLRVLG